MEEDGKKRLRNTSTDNGRSIDRISTLPQDIIHTHILDRLKHKDVKVMSSLSKTWYLLANSFPDLDFSVCSLGNQMLKEDRTPIQPDHIVKFLNYVDQTLLRFNKLNPNQIIKWFSIPFKFQFDTAPILDTWINLVLQHRVEKFDLVITNPPQPDSYRHQSMTCYDLPPKFFSHPNSIIKLAILQGCSLLHSFLTPYTHPNLHLKTLYLYKVLIDETSLSSIISCCPLIEDLIIGQCKGIVNCLRISHLHKLKHLRIEDLGADIEINSPSLEQLSLVGKFRLHIIGDCPILTHLCLFDIQELDLQELLSRLPLLHTLRLGYVCSLTKLKVSSHTLKILAVKSCPNLVQLHIDYAPSLLSVVFTSGSTLPPDLLVSSPSSSVRYNVTLSYTSGTIEDFIFHLSSFVSKIKNVEVLNIYLKKSVENISLEELKRVVQPRVDSVHSFKVFFVAEMKENHVLLLGGLLLTCCPQNLSIRFGMNNHNNYVVENILKKIMMGHREGCRSFKCAKRCWIHHIKDVLCVTKDGRETKLIMDATAVIQSKHMTFLASTSYPEIKFIFEW